jgi:hypothetical protein
MIAFDPNSACEQAKAYYYQYLSGDTKESIPTQTLGHIDRCSSCQADVKRLKVMLAEGEEHAVESSKEANATIATYLRFHFVYLRAFVDCKTLKLFLPSLAIPALEVSVPTPITVHLDNCQQCVNDLQTIRQLKLTGKQHGRLGQLFAEESRVDTNACAEAQNAITSVGAMAFEGASAAILRHLCVCPECRKLLYEDRKGRSEKLPQNLEQSPIKCDAVSAADIFDYVIPYGIDPDYDPNAMFRKALTSHLINCPRCLNKMQKLHDTVYSILERHESGTVTCYKINNSDQDSAARNDEGLYKDWPIQVEVFDSSSKKEPIEAREPVFEVVNNPERRLSLLKLKPFIKPVTAAAAAILIAFLLFNIPVARAVNLSQIGKALEQMRNVYFATFDTEMAEPTQEIWVSQALNIKMLKNRTECVLWDIKDKSRTSKNLSTGSITIAEPDNNVLADVEGTMKMTSVLLPFNSMREAPEDAKWLPDPNEDISTVIPGTQLYDLEWTEKSFNGSIIHRRWRGHIDIETKRPKRIERWIKLAEEDYKLVTVTEVSYPTTDKIKAIIKEVGF